MRIVKEIVSVLVGIILIVVGVWGGYFLWVTNGEIGKLGLWFKFKFKFMEGLVKKEPPSLSAEEAWELAKAMAKGDPKIRFDNANRYKVLEIKENSLVLESVTGEIKEIPFDKFDGGKDGVFAPQTLKLENGKVVHLRIKKGCLITLWNEEKLTFDIEYFE